MNPPNPTGSEADVLALLRKIRTDPRFASHVRGAAKTAAIGELASATARLAVQKAGVRTLREKWAEEPVHKAAKKPMVPCYDDDGNLVGAIDPSRINAKTKAGDEALLDINGTVFGYANARDVQALASAKPTKAKPAAVTTPAASPSPAGDAAPTVDQVQKAHAVVAAGSGRVSDVEFMRAVKTLERYQARKAAR